MEIACSSKMACSTSQNVKKCASGRSVTSHSAFLFDKRVQKIDHRSTSVVANTRVPRATLPLKAVAELVEVVTKQPELSEIKKPQSYVKKNGLPRVVVLGSGWGAMSFVKSLPHNIKEKFELVIVSPRNYFLYTPLLPAVATGTMEERSIVEPVRNLIQGKGEYFEAKCTSIDPVKKELHCSSPVDSAFPSTDFSLPYDHLIVSVGSINNTFGIPGVKERCFYFKTIEHANALRRRVSQCFERAALPSTTDEERKQLLSFVVVGGGPTGVEVAAELHDMIFEDLKRHYSHILKHVNIVVVELMDHLLSSYDRTISHYTNEQFRRNGIRVVLNSRVAAVDEGVVRVVNKKNEESDIPFGACVWATGIAMNPLLKELQSQLPGQNNTRSILTDEHLCVKGSGGSIWALGDASTIEQPKALDHAEALFKEADVQDTGYLTLKQLKLVLSASAVEFKHLEEHARFLDSKTGVSSRFGSLPLSMLKEATSAVSSSSSSSSFIAPSSSLSSPSSSSLSSSSSPLSLDAKGVFTAARVAETKRPKKRVSSHSAALVVGLGNGMPPSSAEGASVATASLVLARETRLARLKEESGGVFAASKDASSASLSPSAVSSPPALASTSSPPPPSTPSAVPHPLENIDDNTLISKEMFRDLLASIDKGLRALPATAQVARQQGIYLGRLFTSQSRLVSKIAAQQKPSLSIYNSNSNSISGKDNGSINSDNRASNGNGNNSDSSNALGSNGDGAATSTTNNTPLPLPAVAAASTDVSGITPTQAYLRLEHSTEPFVYRHKGSTAYIGQDLAVFDVPVIGPLTGSGAGLVWKSFETVSQFSVRTQCLVAFDWVRTKIFGRDISRV